MKLGEFRKQTEHLSDDLELKVEHLVLISGSSNWVISPVEKCTFDFKKVVITVR
jgi:hypothetical protein